MTLRDAFTLAGEFLAAAFIVSGPFWASWLAYGFGFNF